MVYEPTKKNLEEPIIINNLPRQNLPCVHRSSLGKAYLYVTPHWRGSRDLSTTSACKPVQIELDNARWVLNDYIDGIHRKDE